MGSRLTLYHGSSNIIRQPRFGKGNTNNDYGLGFYCTESLDLAKEWACSTETSGYANCYTMNMSGLSVLRLTDGEYHILNWLAILLENRQFRLSSPVAREAKEYIGANYLPDYEKYDVIKGYRADDSYFSFAAAFLNNTISLTQLEKAMTLGKLGEQLVAKTSVAFERLEYEESLLADGDIYFPRKLARDNMARQEFSKERTSPTVEQDTYILDILRERWQNNDPRLQRIILK